MGYFRHKLDRRRSRAHKHAALRHAGAARAVNVAPDRFVVPDRHRPKYVRVAVAGSEPTLRDTTGIFRAVRRLALLPQFDSHERARIKAAFRWFNRHLPVPRHLPKGALCWFRTDRLESWERLNTIVDALMCCGEHVLMLECDAPGQIVYQDEHQVAAVPFADREPELQFMVRPTRR